MSDLRIPDLCLVVLIGASSSGKSTFAARHFKPTEVVSSDVCRGLVSDDPNDQSATGDAFDLLHSIVGKRLRRGKLTVVDATNVERAGRATLVQLARAHDVQPVAVVLDVPQSVCIARSEERSDRDFGPHVVQGHVRDLKRSIGRLEKEGFRRVHILGGVDEVDAASFVRELLEINKRSDVGPFDIVGDVHGCFDELRTLMGDLGWVVSFDEQGRAVDATHPEGRTWIFLGDLVDRGPDVSGVLRLAMGMVEAGHALCINGNHEAKLKRKLEGRNVKLTHGLAGTMEQLGQESERFTERVRGFLDGLTSHYVLDGGALVVAHAGLIEAYHGRDSGRVRAFSLYGETTGESDEFGLPVRHDWASGYRGSACVVYGHTPTPSSEWVNRTICVDTGCVFGGHLTALRWPEKDLSSTPALKTWCEPLRPLVAPGSDGAGQ
jgi:protein phosphatase